MTKKTRKYITEEKKRKAVAEYVSETKTAQAIANEIGTDIQSIYRWRTLFDEEKKGLKISELHSDLSSKELAERLVRQQDEIEAYQRVVAEQTVIIALLKKLRKLGPLPPESELSGLIATAKNSIQKKKRAK
jgi:transposase-like protein